MKSGAYTLQSQTDTIVLNPAADGRKRSDWRFADTFEPGIYFVTVFPVDHHTHFACSVFKEGESTWLSIGQRNSEKYTPFLESLMADDSLRSLVRYAMVEDHLDPVEVLVRLVEAGVVSDDAVRVAVAAELGAQ